MILNSFVSSIHRFCKFVCGTSLAIVAMVAVQSAAWSLLSCDVEAAEQTTPAQARPVYQPAGAPADPKVAARWNKYHDYAEATKLLKSLAEAHPEVCRLQSLGRSYEGREMWLMTITAVDKKKELQTPAFWIDGGIHANEIQATEVVLYTAWYLAESYGRSEAISQMLGKRVFYLLPMLSPDSRDAHMYRPNTTHSPRGGLRPVDDDRDGLVDEDPTDDLDKDGHITQMRRKNPYGQYKPDEKFPSLLVRVKPGEKGSYDLLGREGIDNDEDGRVNEDGDGYYDPNRDWAWNWQPASRQRGAYRYPFSILENRMAADFILAHPNIAGGQSYHNTGGMLLKPPGGRGEKLPQEDNRIYARLGKQGEEILPGYRALETGADLYEAFGTTVDWLYGMRGVFAFTNELNTPYNMFHQKSQHGYFGKQQDHHKFDELLLFGNGFVGWKAFDHPKYGKIEIGGVKKNWVRQPPSFMIEEECHRNMAFTLYHAAQMPEVQIDSVAVKSLGRGLTEVTATVVNPNMIPTHSARDVEKRITPPDTVSISGEKVKVVTAFTSSSPLFEEKSEHALRPERISVRTLKELQPVYVRWLVEGNGKFTIRVESQKGGVARRGGKIGK